NFIFDHTWSRDTASSIILKVTFTENGAIEYSKKWVRLDSSYIPRFTTDTARYDHLDTAAHRYRDNEKGYRRYQQKRELTSRVLSFLDLAVATLLTPRKTAACWHHIFQKRLKKQ
ncbi:MAG: hypothetical protein JW795_10305, partial [Chitinivibrionales bacterium]|nr:hypothetical protein [Chitinivibrionales bacterium]